MCWKKWSPAFKRYQLRVIGWSLLYAVTLLGAVWLFKHRPPQGALRYVVAVAPALPLVGVIASIGLFLKDEDDEFLRALMVEQILWATGGLLMLGSVWGFLETFSVAPHVEAYWGVVSWFGLFGVARAITLMRHR